jgi:hypothetical protein
MYVRPGITDRNETQEGKLGIEKSSAGCPKFCPTVNEFLDG